MSDALCCSQTSHPCGFALLVGFSGTWGACWYLEELGLTRDISHLILSKDFEMVFYVMKAAHLYNN